MTNCEPIEDTQLLSYILLLVKYSRLIIYTTISAMAVTLIILLLVPNQYTATAVISPPQQNITLSGHVLESLGGSVIPSASLTAAKAGLGAEAAALMGLGSSSDYYVGVMNTVTIFDRIIERFNLINHYRPWKFLGAPYIEDIRKILKGRTEISAAKDGLIKIKVTDKDPNLAAKIANAFAEEMDTLLQGISHEEAKERLNFLEQERSGASLKLAKAEGDLRAFSDQSGLIKLDDQTKGIIEYIAKLRAAIDTKEVQLEVMRQRATPSNFDVKQIETELKSLRERLYAAETKDINLPRDGDIFIATTKMPTLGLEYLRLYRESKYQESLYQMFSKLEELARLDQVRHAVVIAYLDQANPPQKKSKPQRFLLTMLAGIVTCFAMILVAFGLEYWHNVTQSETAAMNLQLIHRYAQLWQQDTYRFSTWVNSRILRRSDRH
jgi:tyrosine-protein kinase Etk/Wzc